MQSVLQDIRYALRQLRKSPGFTITAVLTLALGVGASTAMFSIFDAVVLSPLAYRDSGQLVVAWERVRYLSKDYPYVGPNPRHVDLWRRTAKSFSDLAMVQEGTGGVAIGEEHPRLIGTVAGTSNLLRMLGVQPLLGRDFRPEEESEGRQNVAILSWSLWQSLFHGDPHVLGKTIKSGWTTREVIGVLPKNFTFPKQNELTDTPRAGENPAIAILTPLAVKVDGYSWTADFGNFIAVGRLRPGVTPRGAEAELNSIANDILRKVPPGELDGDPEGALASYVQPLKKAVVGATSTRLTLLLAAVLSVLLIACVNLANAQLARAAVRENEVGIRSALGASPLDLVRSLLVEVAILSAIGGALGIALSKVLISNFPKYAAVSLPRVAEIGLSSQVLVVALALTCGSMVLFGSLPAFSLLRLRPRIPMHGNGSRSLGAPGGKKLRNWLIGGQVCACTALLLTTGLVGKSLLNLLTGDKGFSTQQVVTANVQLTGKQYTDEGRIAFDDAVLERLGRLPGVTSAALVSAQPLTGDSWIDGMRPLDRREINSQANYRWISPGYFDTLQQHIVSGRDLNAQDRIGTNAVISQAAARAAWPGQDAVGRRFRRGGSDQTLTVIGVAADARTNSLRAPPTEMVFLPYWNNPPYRSFFMVRTDGDPALLLQAVRKTIWDYDPSVTIASVNTLASEASDSLGPERLEATLIGAFAGAALLLALLGIYGTLSYSIQSRVREIGLRMALGATRGNVYLLGLKELLAPVGVGLGLGWLLSLAIGKSFSALLYETRAYDSWVAAAVFCIFTIAAIAATFVPCRRAAAIEPMQALRAE